MKPKIPKVLLQFTFVLGCYSAVSAAELHVALTGKDTHPGTAAAPMRTIQQAAQLAQPGDTITVHAGIYRESINPPRGGTSDAQRITYQAAPGEKVEIKGSEIVTGWEKVGHDTWKVTVPNTLFGTFNPYADLIAGNWFTSKKRKHHTGAVYVDGVWLYEAAQLEEVIAPAGKNPLWFGQVGPETTTVHAQFKGVNPNERMTEINVRQTVFYPDQPGRDYITVRGFTLRHAATNWAPPTAEQKAVIGTNWSKGWVIENNTVSHSVCTGISLGKHGDEFDNKSGGATGYVQTIKRAHAKGWNKETIGGHVVRNNTISDCEQAGIVGSMGGSFSTITGNRIHDIHVRQLFSGCEQAGIKLHGPIDTLISHNHIYRTCRGIWLDWMTQGTQITDNLLHDNNPPMVDGKQVKGGQPGGYQDIFFEVNHGPFLVANNLFLSKESLSLASTGGAFVHNLFAGSARITKFDDRLTPFHPPHSTEIVDFSKYVCGDTRFFNNLFIGGGSLGVFEKATTPVAMEGNVFLNGYVPAPQEKQPLTDPTYVPSPKIVEKSNGFYLVMKYDKSWTSGQVRQLVTTALLGKTIVSKAAFVNPDGSPIQVATDCLGKPRNPSNPTPGPIELPGEGMIEIKIR